jgi:hypothetical protein
VDAGYVVVPVNHDLIARRRGPARKKDAAADACIACLLALDRHVMLGPLIPMGSWPGSWTTPASWMGASAAKRNRSSATTVCRPG